jgi:hypothetical protein
MKKTLLTSALIATIATPGSAEKNSNVQCGLLREVLESNKLIMPSELSTVWDDLRPSQKRSINHVQRVQLWQAYFTYCR